MSDGWSYYSWVTKVSGVKQLDDGLNALGADGWELVTALSSVKALVVNAVGGNDIVLLFKKPGAGQTPSAEAVTVAAGMGDAAY